MMIIIISKLSIGLTLHAAAKEALDYMSVRVKGSGGVIVIDRSGDMAHYFTTSRMAWASVRSDIMKHGLEPNEVLEEKIELLNS